MKLQRLDHFGIEVRDLARAERFYREVLELAVVTLRCSRFLAPR
jgi:catechol 2,3-dioxygenase-like lactoylglutathione lyase family enzyme